MFYRAVLLASASGCVLLHAQGDSSAAGQPGKVPELRDLNPDRPSLTDNPDTLDTGHLESEFDFANYGWTHQDRATTRSWNFIPPVVRYGLTPKAEIQVSYDSYSISETKDRLTGKHMDSRSWGDLKFRLKYNFWGNGDGPTSFGIIPSIKLPTATGDAGVHDAVEGGVSLPFYADLGSGWNVTLNVQANAVHDDSRCCRFNGFAGATLGRQLTDSTAVYVESINSDTPGIGHSRIGLIDAGFAWTLTKNLQVDCGCNFGVSANAERYHPFVGMSVRF